MRLAVIPAVLAGLVAGTATAQHRYRGGSFEGLMAMRRPADVGIVHMPCLQLFLEGQEKDGKPLTAVQFRSLRNLSPAIEMDQADIATFAARRGCTDPQSYQEYLSRR